jgi:7-cyano-7-deazaguanine reductase
MMRDWDYKKVMEGMSDSELAERISEVMDLEMPHKIRPIPYVGKSGEVVEYETNELIARCPVTGYPDIYTIRIKFIPDKLLPELKSLKFYYMDFLDLPISHEHLAAKIYRYFAEVVEPEKLQLELIVAIRGGIATTVTLGSL